MSQKREELDQYLGYRIVVDINDFVEVLDDNRGHILQLLEVKLPVCRDITVECYRCQVTDGNLFNTSHTQVLYALRVLRAHGLCDSALQTIYHSVVIAKLCYALCLGRLC